MGNVTKLGGPPAAVAEKGDTIKIATTITLAIKREIFI
jgi:hypothetical protein